MKMKKLTAVLASMVVAAGVLTGCGSSASTSTGTESSAAAQTAAAESTAAEEAETAGATEAAAEEVTEAAEESTEEGTTEEADLSEDTVTVRVGTLQGPTTMGLVNLWSRSDAGTSEGSYEFTMESTPDALTPKIVSGDIDIALVPSNLASVLYNRTEGNVSVIDINTLGVLYCVTGDDSIETFTDLDGKTIVTTGQGANPEYSIRYLLDAYGIDAELDFRSEATEVASVLADDPSTIAILPQPFATVACLQNDQLREAFSLNDSWDEAADGKSRMVQGVTIVRNDFLEEYPDAVTTFMEEQKESTEAAAEDVAGTAQLVADYGIVAKAQIAEKALPKCSITYIDGEDMKTAVSGFLEVLAGFNPKSVGGSLPGDDFYYIGE